ncbi:MAG: hypothetical protein KGM17_04215 [Sphingomonadales bacterium]|nr:hypothetical protein [Sphingomonadales bacterium]
MKQQLPAGYEALEYFVDRWAIKGTANRCRRRGEASPEERVAFFEAVKPILPRALEELDAKPLDQLDDREERLLDLLLSFAHVTHAVEMLGDAEPRHARFRLEMPFNRSSADQWN